MSGVMFYYKKLIQEKPIVSFVTFVGLLLFLVFLWNSSWVISQADLFSPPVKQSHLNVLISKKQNSNWILRKVQSRPEVSRVKSYSEKELEKERKTILGEDRLVNPKEFGYHLFMIEFNEGVTQSEGQQVKNYLSRISEGIISGEVISPQNANKTPLLNKTLVNRFPLMVGVLFWIAFVSLMVLIRARVQTYLNLEALYQRKCNFATFLVISWILYLAMAIAIHYFSNTGMQIDMVIVICLGSLICLTTLLFKRRRIYE